jgi:hypothetical protein
LTVVQVTDGCSDQAGVRAQLLALDLDERCLQQGLLLRREIQILGAHYQASAFGCGNPADPDADREVCEALEVKYKIIEFGIFLQAMYSGLQNQATATDRKIQAFAINAMIGNNYHGHAGAGHH